MKKTELVYREILYQFMEKENNCFTQKELSLKLGTSISNVNQSLTPFKKMYAIKTNPRNFTLVNSKKILYYWASVRNLKKDIIYSTRVDKSVAEIEKNMTADVIYGAYSAYKFKFKQAPSDYSEVYVYSNSIDEIKKRFPHNKNNPNLFVLKKDSIIDKYGKTTTFAHTFVDLWNLEEWYAKEFLKEMEKKINRNGKIMQKWNTGIT